MALRSLTGTRAGVTALVAAVLLIVAGMLATSPASAAGTAHVTVANQDGKAVADPKYATTVTLHGSGFQSIKGGFGGILFRAHEWASREATLRSYELFARYVMPRFQGSLDTIVGSNEWARENRKAVFGPTVAAVKKAFTDVGRDVPDEFRSRTVGARDVAD